MFASKDMFDVPSKDYVSSMQRETEEAEEWSVSDGDDDVVHMAIDGKKNPSDLHIPSKDASESWSDEDEDQSPVVPCDQQWEDNPVMVSNFDSPAVMETHGRNMTAAMVSEPPTLPPTPYQGACDDSFYDIGVIPQTPSAAATSAALMRKAQLDKMRENELRKRTERLGGAGKHNFPPAPFVCLLIQWIAGIAVARDSNVSISNNPIPIPLSGSICNDSLPAPEVQNVPNSH